MIKLSGIIAATYLHLNSIRSSRVLEKECKRNVEVMWLMKQLVPDHNTISNFRRDNEKEIPTPQNYLKGEMQGMTKEIAEEKVKVKIKSS